MTHRGLSRAGLVAAVALIASGATARGQGYFYPPGFGGWGGWGATTAFGDEARGMGMFAAGVGAYNLDTSQARSINADTTMRVNEYMWESQQIRNQMYYRQLAERRQRINEGAAQTLQRLRENPDTRDIRSGDALNVVLDELTDPRVYIQSVKAAAQPIPSQMVKSIPFQYAPQAITISLSELSKAGVPDVLRTNQALQTERAALRAAVDKAKSEVDEKGSITPETLQEARSAAQALLTKVREVLPSGRERREAENFLKAVLGLTKMLETPDLDRFLRELDTMSNTTLAALLSFMQSFNLRFGSASNPTQNSTYDQLYPMLVALRDQINPQGSNPLAVELTPEDHAKAREAFSQLEFEHFNPQPPINGNAPAQPTPPPPAPGSPE